MNGRGSSSAGRSRRDSGQGYATKSARLALDWGFETLKTDEIISAIHPDNAASIRVAERFGETYARDEPLHGTPFRIYAITRDAWRKGRDTRT